MNHRNQKLIQEYRAVFDERRQIIIHHRRVRLHNNPYSKEKILLSVAVACLLSAATLGAGALACWGFEIIDANIPHVNSWSGRKNICLGGIALFASGFVGMGLVGVCTKVNKNR